MGSRVVKIEFNSPEIGEFLASGPDLISIVDDAGDSVEAALPGAIEETRTKAKGNDSFKPFYTQEVFREDGHAMDGRYQVRVGVRNYSNSDFVFNTLGAAVFRAGGRYSRRG